MSNLGPLAGGRAQGVPTPPRGDTIARYATYLEAQRAVDYLSDNAFPVQAVTIVGTGLRMVERVTGRLTYSIVALRSLLSGAYFGAMVGLILSLFTTAGGSAILAGALFGAGFSVIFGLIAYSLTGGRRDFSSVSQVVATEYEVLCLPEQMGRARELLGQLRSQGGPGPIPLRSDPGHPPAQPPPPPYGTSPGPYGPPPTYPPTYPPAGGQQPPAYSPEQRTERAAAGPGQPGPGELPAQPPVSGPTYGEMIEKQRRERLEREAAERRAAQPEQGAASESEQSRQDG